ncbi:MAG: hypothetical protein LBS97_02265 [Treponema sp.]|jgi:hypothetical protein|nr:hypothetical protein [Treponema sp.]
MSLLELCNWGGFAPSQPCIGALLSPVKPKAIPQSLCFVSVRAVLLFRNTAQP